MKTTTKWRSGVTLLPVLLLVALAATGIASAIQSDDAEETIDLGPQPGDFLDAAGETDIAGYVVGAAVFREAPAVPIEEELELRVFGCTEGSPVTVALVPRVLNAPELEAQDALDDDAKLLTEPLGLVDEAEALADGSSYTVELPATTPLGFARFRVACEGADGDLLTDAVVNAVVRADFEAAQENLADDEEPTELVTTVDAGDTPEALVVNAG